MASITVTPSGSALGAEITGVDIAAGIDESTVLAIRDAVLRYSVVAVRDQKLSPADQTAFTHRIGQERPSTEAYTDYSFNPPGYPQLLIVSNIQENGRKIGISDAGVLWHTDNAFQTDPDVFVTLYGIEVPMRDGTALGNTLFVSTPAAYDGLDQATRQRIAGLRVVHSYGYHLEKMAKVSPGTRALDTEKRKQITGISHPLVRTHPITGRKLLYVTESFSDFIEGMDEGESRELLDQLCAHIVRDEFRYSHTWRQGDLVIWDNVATQHRATFDYGRIPRRLHRCGTLGPRPV